eukprot:gnl/TRDRNA2_/TRDRNA2_32597_c0_seq1.p1 gnl/TRDRNA2_/TRDRNA2_32597_c0~~gnl/TRDRNA2_/TRDRNA2_32597_c0_seq1.p1  ORF type:complete len:128 (+),score=1.47 gnl/TRDRNA2_/TRDRNA2_32597_c0_seq1:133-516(+)
MFGAVLLVAGPVATGLLSIVWIVPPSSMLSATECGVPRMRDLSSTATCHIASWSNVLASAGLFHMCDDICKNAWTKCASNVAAHRRTQLSCNGFTWSRPRLSARQIILGYSTQGRSSSDVWLCLNSE